MPELLIEHLQIFRYGSANAMALGVVSLWPSGQLRTDYGAVEIRWPKGAVSSRRACGGDGVRRRTGPREQDVRARCWVRRPAAAILFPPSMESVVD
jgi:hypothetical protein